MSTCRLLVIQHEDDAPPAWLGVWLTAAGVEIDVVHAHRGEPVPAHLGGYDALVVLGGAMGAYDDEAHPWLTATKQLIAATVAAERYFLGICLGHQLGAVALGGTVAANPGGQALGLTPVTLTEEGRRDELLGAVSTRARSIQWNDDIVTRLPDGALTLATAPDGTIQAARLAATAWGVQFHPEASPKVFHSWIDSENSADRATRDRLRTTLAAIEEAEDELRSEWEPVARRFAELVASRSRLP